MSLSRYLLGVVLLGAFVASIGVTARSITRRLLPRWSGAPAALAGIVIGLATTILLAEVLGALRIFHVVPAVLASAGCAAASVMWSRRPTDAPPTAPDAVNTDGGNIGGGNIGGGNIDAPAVSAPTDRASVVACVVVVAVLCAAWGTRTIEALHDGMSGSIDTIWYHLPAAARFAQTGVITDVHFFDNASLTAFYPASTPLLHALGIELLGSDLLSPVLNFGFLALTLLAAWCLGRAFGVASVALVAVAAVLATPMLTVTQPGGAYNDVAGIAFLLAALALLAEGRAPRGGWSGQPFGVAAIAAGLAVGTKYNFIVPVAAVSVGVIVLATKEQRVRQAFQWAGLLLLSGGFFYIRNLVIVGNPVPAVAIHFGSWSLPHPPSGVEEIAPLSVFGEGRLWRLFFRPGLESAFGPLWWLVLLLIGVGLVAAIATRRDSYVRMVGFVAAVSTLGYLVTPASIGTKKIPNQFVYSLRYMAGAAVLAVVALAISALGRRFRRPLFWMFVAVVLAMQLDPSIWPTDLRAQRFWEPVHGAFSVAAVVFGVVVLVVGCALVVVRWRAPAWRPSLLLSVALVMAAVVTGAVVHDVYVRNQLEDSWYLPATYRWARSVHDERIAVVGTPLQYPLYGEDLSNHVQYVGRRGRHGSFFPINSCRAWRRALTAGRYDYVVIAANPVTFRRRIEATWTESDPGAALELRDGDATVFRIDAPLDPDGCDQLGPRAIARTNSE